MAIKLLVGKRLPFAISQKFHLVGVNVGQCVARLQLAHRSVVFPVLIFGPELRIDRCAVGGKDDAHLAHALHQAATSDGFIVGMGHDHQGVFQQ